MGVIKKLPEQVVRKIAAGEVIERPVSVVKELIENALDAKATFIWVQVTDGGIEQIVVTDNGGGMDAQDTHLSWQAHTTSKLHQEDDLQRLTSFGFRGEALASIAAVSRVTIASRTAMDSVGTAVTVEGGRMTAVSPKGMPVGTRVTVKELFRATPARRHFLQSPTQELRRIARLVTQVALLCPTVGFLLKQNQEVLLHVPSDQTSDQRLRQLLGDRVQENLMPVRYQGSDVRFEGFVGKPQIARSVPSLQYVAVNGRPVKDRLLAKAIKDVYGSLLAPRLHPAFVLSLNLKPQAVDVNIHPRKEEIKMAGHEDILKMVQRVVGQTLTQQETRYRYYADLASQTSLLMDEGAAGRTVTVLRDAVEAWQIPSITTQQQEIAQIHRLYLVTQTHKGLLIIDQHAAHERILYEQFHQVFAQAASRPDRCMLQPAAVFDVPVAEVATLQEQLPVLASLGFEVELFGQTTFKIVAVPRLFADRDCAALIIELVDELATGSSRKSFDDISERTIAFLACRSASKAGDHLNSDERRQLLEKLSQTTSNYTCPHGRPVQVEIPIPELHRMFKRQ